MKDSTRAILAIFIVMVVVYISVLFGQSGSVPGDAENEALPVLSQIQYSALMADSDLDWGIALSAENVTETGLTVTCKQSGGKASGELSVQSPYVLDVLNDGQWFVADLADPHKVPQWPDEIRTIEKESSTSWNVDWSVLYGSLKPGSYRISQEISDAEESDEGVTNTYFIYFTIE